MAEAWYCRIAGEQIGPLTAAQLRALVESGRLMPDDPVSTTPAGPWVEARRVRGLFTPTATAQQAWSGGECRPDVPRTADAEVARGGTSDSGPLDFLNEISAVPAKPKGAARPAARGNEPLDFLQEVQAESPPSVISERTVVPTKSRRQQRLFLTVLLGLLGTLTVLVVVLGVITTLRDPAPSSRLPQAAREAVVEADRASAEESSKAANPKAKAGKTSGPVQALDARKETWKVGDISVRVASAEIARPGLVLYLEKEKRITGKGRHTEDLLVIRLQLTNTSTTRKLDFLRWENRAVRPRLVDNYNNEYPLQTLSTGYFVEGETLTRTIRPEQTIQQVLLFEKPVDKAQTLLLELPGAALKGSGTGFFNIPISMLVQLPDKAATESSPGASKPEAGASEGSKPITGKPDATAPAPQGKGAFESAPTLDLKPQGTMPAAPAAKAEPEDGKPEDGKVQKDAQKP